MFYLDRVGAVYLFCVWAIFSIIIKYCRVYLHREDGYKRFFLTIFGFVFGLNLVIMSCSIDMLFAGWEIAGIASLLLLSSLILIGAPGKSAQFPFCFWLPRAMEGPTPSSAIFYGALSVYLGVFLLLRTTPIWIYHYFTRFIVFAIGLLTVIVASISKKTQSNIKGQIACASSTQGVFMFMELALGLESLMLIHFFGNAFLRCYQLLESPSIVAHLLGVEGSTDTDFYIRNHSRFQFCR